MEHDALRPLIAWNDTYVPSWDGAPERYHANGLVDSGKSRRLGVLKLAQFKAYLGVQHVDTSQPGWRALGESHTRFFVSMFVNRRCISLRTYPTMDAALFALLNFMRGK
ncbi:MAG: hypothetical protein ABI670_18160 [Chloroflexota bacterium]